MTDREQQIKAVFKQEYYDFYEVNNTTYRSQQNEAFVKQALCEFWEERLKKTLAILLYTENVESMTKNHRHLTHWHTDPHV
jgi:hypothetical protein